MFEVITNIYDLYICNYIADTTISIVLKEGYFSIEDEGVGIEKEKLNEIFELYKRGSTLAGGFGVGLNIVKQICDEFKIEILVSSEYEVGSKFELRW
nr:ATP-binding protein [Sulfurimonas gotlandica]